MYAEFRELRQINADIKALQLHLAKKKSEPRVPDWFITDDMKAEGLQMLTFAEKYQTIDIRETNLLPRPANRGPDFDERLREAMDVDAMIEESA